MNRIHYENPRCDDLQPICATTAHCGVTLVEVLVAILLSTVVVSMIASMSVRIQHIWKEINHRRIALTELNNQLEELTRLPHDQMLSALGNLQADTACQTVLDDVRLEGEAIPDQLGTRITLRINWQRRVPGLPLQLSGWLIDNSTTESTLPTDSSETTNTGDDNDQDQAVQDNALSSDQNASSGILDWRQEQNV